MSILENNTSTFNKEKSIKIIKIIVIILVFLFVAVMGILYAIYYMHSKEFKVIIDGTHDNKISSDSFIIDGDKVYVSIKDISDDLNYKYNNGEYKQYSEDKTSCYVQNDYEAATYSLNSTTMYKSIISETASDQNSSATAGTTSLNSASTANEDNSIAYESYTLDEPVIMKNDKLYTTMQGIATGFNVSISYNKEKNSLEIATLPKMVSYYTNKMPEAAIADEKAIFSNKKAVLYNLIVVKNGKNEYGVYDKNGNEVIGEKYASVKFLEGSQEFIVKTVEGKMGIISKDGTTKIKPEYDTIKQIDKDTGLYLVSANNKYGVINKNGKVLVYLEYDKIGIDTTQFPNDNIKSGYILYDNCIPVQKGDKWGLMDKNGNVLLDVKYDSLGCIEGTSNDKVANNLLLIPEYEGIVVSKDNLYGLINSSGKELIPPLVTDMYSVTTSGVNNYFLTYNKQTMNVIDYLKNTLKIAPVDKNAKKQNENVVDNVVQNQNTVITNTANGIENQ